MSHFEYTDPDGDRLRIEPVPARPSVLLILGTQGEDDTACLRIPLHHVEEVIAGLRDMARQTGPLPGARITDEQRAHAAAVLPPGARITAQALHAAEEAGA
ncbi:hypothetical protein [Streptomyces sp. NBC_01233]|uniref:hypothetical protein n=1 Tax=Streptomyces sp. NBC_01233 TaxID=2903787 RepID=UPI002E14C6C8|nr:hypothetical protein OG332_10590 [Streptomyces sp. NBC_01233]